MGWAGEGKRVFGFCSGGATFVLYMGREIVIYTAVRLAVWLYVYRTTRGRRGRRFFLIGITGVKILVLTFLLTYDNMIVTGASK